MSDSAAITHDLASARFRAAFRLAVPDAPRRRHVSEATGIPLRTLESYGQESTPGLANLMRLARVLGSAFLSDVLAPAGMRVEAIDGCDKTAHEHLTGLLRYAGKLSEALDDGMIDHRERAQLAPPARELGCQLIAWAARDGPR